jgi:hypothetical protein
VLKQMPDTGERQGSGKPSQNGTVTPPTLPDLGIGRKDASESAAAPLQRPRIDCNWGDTKRDLTALAEIKMPLCPILGW